MASKVITAWIKVVIRLLYKLPLFGGSLMAGRMREQGIRQHNNKKKSLHLHNPLALHSHL